MPGAQCTRSLVCSKESTRVRHHRSTGTPGIPYAMVLTVSFVLSPVIGLVCHRHPRKLGFRELDAGVEASGPHDFAVRSSAARPARAARVHRIPPRVRDVRNAPLSGGTREPVPLICPTAPAEYFLRQDWTGQITLIGFNKFTSARRARICPTG
jgi:hypothetical protein